MRNWLLFIQAKIFLEYWQRFQVKDFPGNSDAINSDGIVWNHLSHYKTQSLNPNIQLFLSNWLSELSDEDKSYFKKHLLTENDLDDSTIVCTACFRQVNHKHAGAVLRHSELGVPVCKQCFKFYHAGEWTKGEDGFYDFCRWCANGGDLLMCDSCPNAFCKKCIKRNLGRSKVSEIEELEKWDCLACEPAQIRQQRSLYYSIWFYQKNFQATEEEKELKSKREAKTLFIEETLKDGFDVNKILGNYLERAKKSWTKKSYDYTKEDLAKVVIKLRTIIKVTHHNLE